MNIAGKHYGSSILLLCFSAFKYDKIASYDDKDLERIPDTEGMIRSPRKVQAVIGITCHITVMAVEDLLHRRAVSNISNVFMANSPVQPAVDKLISRVGGVQRP